MGSESENVIRGTTLFIEDAIGFWGAGSPLLSSTRPADTRRILVFALSQIQLVGFVRVGGGGAVGTQGLPRAVLPLALVVHLDTLGTAGVLESAEGLLEVAGRRRKCGEHSRQ